MRTITFFLLFPAFSVTGGFYDAQFATDIRAGQLGTPIRVERDLGLQSSQRSARYAVQWQPFRRHELAASYFSANRTGFRSITEGIQFEDEFYPIESDVTSRLDMRYWDATYTVWVMRRERQGLGLTIGAAGMSIDAGIEATIPGGTATLSEEAETEVPIALVGAQYRVALQDRLHGELRAAVLPRVEIDVYSGRALSSSARLEYAITPNIGLGAAYNYFDLDGTVEDPSFTGDIGLEVKGLEAYVRLAIGR